MTQATAEQPGRIRRTMAFILGKPGGQIFLVIFLLLVAYFFGLRGMRFFRVPSESMLPTLHPTDQLVTLKEKTYRRGDIVVMRDTEDGGYFVKRIAGKAGDELLVQGGALYINGGYASEPYVMEPMRYAFREPTRVPEGRVFVLGDNRNNSDDSSIDLKSFPEEDIVGRVCYIYFPYSRFGGVPSYPLAPSPSP